MPICSFRIIVRRGITSRWSKWILQVLITLLIVFPIRDWRRVRGRHSLFFEQHGTIWAWSSVVLWLWNILRQRLSGELQGSLRNIYIYQIENTSWVCYFESNFGTKQAESCDVQFNLQIFRILIGFYYDHKTNLPFLWKLIQNKNQTPTPYSRIFQC